jgi:hypothetical protein
LTDVTTILRGTVPAKPTDGGVGQPFVGIAEISAGGAGALRRVEGSEVDERAVHLAVGDVVIALMGNLGQSLLITGRHAGSVLGRECAAMRPSSQEITGAWIYVWTLSADFRAQVERTIGGSTMPRLSLRGLPALTLPVPDLSTQQEVEGMLGDLERAISSTSEVLGQLQELRRVEVDIALARWGER